MAEDRDATGDRQRDPEDGAGGRPELPGGEKRGNVIPFPAHRPDESAEPPPPAAA